MKSAQFSELNEIKTQADRGDPLLQAQLGAMYFTGQGAPQNDAEAVKWWHKAAKQGVADAQFKLGAMYYSGNGVPQDFIEAYKWISLSAAQGDENAANAHEMIAHLMTEEQLAESRRRIVDFTLQFEGKN